MADRWHPNDRRKIQRSLEIFLTTGKQASQIYNDHRTKNISPVTEQDDQITERCAGARFSTLVFWTYANKDMLHPRLDNRVDKMVSKGLLAEVDQLSNFRKSHEDYTGASIDQSRGIWASIGYKEFLDYQQALAEQSQSTSEIEALKSLAIQKTQAATRQYANRQARWIRIKLLNALSDAAQEGNAFLLDGSDLSKWTTEVVDSAVTITKQFLSGEPLPAPSTLSATAAEVLSRDRKHDLGQRPDLWVRRTCDTCDLVFVIENDWNMHIKSRAHRRALGARKKQDRAQNAPRRDRGAAQTDVVDVLETYMDLFPEEDSSK